MKYLLILCYLSASLAIACQLGGCTPASDRDNPGSTPSSNGSVQPPTAASLVSLDLNDFSPSSRPSTVELRGARNEWVSFALEIPASPSGQLALRLPKLEPSSGGGTGAIERTAFDAAQILPLPVDVARAGYVRHTGVRPGQKRLPRALLPLPAADGRVPLSRLRDSSVRQVWVDLHIPSDAPALPFAGTCELVQNGRAIASLPVRLVVYNFTLPDERHLQIVGKLWWDSLGRLYPDTFETIRPRLLNRAEPRYKQAVTTLDQMVAIAQKHRVVATVPRLQPTVKWPANEPPQVDWTDFDSLVTPWLSGEAFADRVPLSYWPLPAPDQLETYDRSSQLQYWHAAAEHFDQADWIGRSSAWVEKITPGRPRAADAIELSQMAAQLLALHPRLRVTAPLEEDQVQFSSASTPGLIDPESAARLGVVSPGLVFSPSMRAWPANARRPSHWLRTDLPGLVPYAGAGGDERDVRLWAWLAYLRDPSQPTDAPTVPAARPMIAWNEVLPSFSDPSDLADPNELVWFYPGQWFGLSEPVPSVQLKWLRRAQQDFEYLWLAGQRGETLNALVMARLMTKPVEIQPAQAPDPTYALMSGTADAQAWTESMDLLAATILLHTPGQPADAQQQRTLYINTLRWLAPLERPLLLPAISRWGLEQHGGVDRLHLQMGIDIYNASDRSSENRPDRNTLQWTQMAAGWQIDPRPLSIAALATYHVRREFLDAQFDPTKITPATRKPMEFTFTSGFDNRTAAMGVVMPVAASDRREGALRIDGDLPESEWHAADLLQDGPMVRMLSRPALQRQQLQFAEGKSRLYSGWAERNFYVAFDLEGISPGGAGPARNFVDYQFRRAWGEDLCEVLIQPIDDKGTPGAVMHVVCKPNGSTSISRKPGPRLNWQEVETKVPYSSITQNGHWRGELAIPWEAILGDGKPIPALLRFNFAQHRPTAGESASWCGPIDFGRDESLMGALYLRDPEAMRLGMPERLR